MLVEKGELFLIYPGGMKEGLTSNGYKLLWKPNAGFAKVAQKAKVVRKSLIVFLKYFSI